MMRSTQLKQVTFALLLAQALGTVSPHAHASLIRPSQGFDPEADHALRAQFISRGNLLSTRATSDGFKSALNDELSRIQDSFKVPEALRSSVGFWLKVFTEYSTRHVVFYDREHPEVIYEVLDLRDVEDGKSSTRKIAVTYANYQAAFRKLIAKGKGAAKTSYEKKVVAALKNTSHKHPLREFAENFRAQTGQRDHLMKGMLAAEPYMPRMEEVFSAIGVPAELTRLSLVESGFDPSAVSKVGASGVWQFMHKSALEFMHVDEKRKIDERLSPMKSTIAAARLLKRNRKVLGDWPLAITSYNHGLKGLIGVSKQLKTRKGMESVFSLCSKNSPLGWASRNYYSEFLAVLHAEAYRDLFFGEMPAATVPPFAFLKVDRSTKLASIALDAGISLREIQSLNPDVRDPSRPLPKGYWVVLPEGTRKSVSVKETLAEFGKPKPRG